MENRENSPRLTATATAAVEASLSGQLFPTSPPLAASFPPPSPVVFSPCAACKILRRRCVEKCVLAPYFPPTDPLKFTIAHRVFGASNIIKLLQELPESQRADAVSSMVYEANARLRDPVYGCAGAICLLQKQINELQVELAKAQADVLNFQCQNASLLDLIISKSHGKLQDFSPPDPIMIPYLESSTLFLDESIQGDMWESLYGHESFL